jgi:hypothetical protein
MKAAEEAKKTVAGKKDDLRKSQTDRPELL